MEILRLEQLSFQYPTGDREVLQDINLCIQSGEFIVLCGNSGSGKTTLLRHLKSTVMPHGQRNGRILFHGTPLSETELREQTGRLGFVGQNPEDQLVTDRVWHELAFGLESLGVDNQTIRKRVAEMSHFFGIQEWFHRKVTELSGGQKQLLNLASVMVMQPELLLLDEPTSQLDPIAASDFLGALHRIHQELGTTILMTEHRLEEVLPYCSRLVVLEQGTVVLDGTPRAAAEEMRRRGLGMFAAMPAPMRIWNGVEQDGSLCPLTVQEGREWFTAYHETHVLLPTPEEQGERNQEKKECSIALKDIWFRYDKKGRDILQELSLCAYKGEILSVLGGNGSGKTTILSVINKGLNPYRGKVLFPDGEKRVITLSQDPQLLFVETTVQRELEAIQESGSIFEQNSTEQQSKVASMIELCKLEGLSDRHPYDLSGGEQQRLALAKVLLAQPEILLLDEPTKGLDVEYKASFAGILRQLTRQGITIIMVSHDVEFCAEYADRCALVFDGQVVAEAAPRQFFSENHFYTTNTNRMVRHILPLAVTVEDVIQACGAEKKNGSSEEREENSVMPDRQKPVSGSEAARGHLPIWTVVGISMMLLAIPLTIFTGIYFLGDEKYVFISLLILLECMLPFFLAYEGRKPPARDLIVLSVLCSIGVAGRGVFSAIPQFKPVTAVTMIAGAAYGGETGFLTGALTMLISNMIFAQGPWTPWQMFAMGMIGLFSGLLFHKRENERSLPLLCAYGFIAPIVLYGGIMNPASAIMAGIAPDWNVIGAYWLSGLPFDVMHGCSTILFLFLGAKPMLRMLERVKIKFG